MAEQSSSKLWRGNSKRMPRQPESLAEIQRRTDLDEANAGVIAARQHIMRVASEILKAKAGASVDLQSATRQAHTTRTGTR